MVPPGQDVVALRQDVVAPGPCHRPPPPMCFSRITPGPWWPRRPPWIWFVQFANGVEIIPRPGIPVDLVTTVRLRTDPGAPPVLVEVHLTADPEQFTRLISVGTEPREATCQRMVQPYIDEQIAGAVAERDAQHAEELATERAKHQRELAEKETQRAHDVLDATEKTLLREASYTSFRRVLLDNECVGDEIAICPDAYVNSEERGVLSAWVLNHSSQEPTIAQAQVVDQVSHADHAVSFLVTDERDQPASVIEQQ